MNSQAAATADIGGSDDRLQVTSDGDRLVIVCSGRWVLEHVAELAPIYREAARVLTPGGNLFFCELHPARQYTGSQAHFRDSETGEEVWVPAHLHDASEYVNAGLAAGLDLLHLGEWRDAGRARTTAPRLISIHLQRPPR